MCPTNGQFNCRTYAYILTRKFHPFYKLPNSNNDIFCTYHSNHLRSSCSYHPILRLYNLNLPVHLRIKIIIKNNPFHLVEQRPWPLISSFSALLLLSILLFSIHHPLSVTLTASILITWGAFTWWQDVHREASFQGLHSLQVINGLKVGMILFISSEVLFFSSFFWAFFHSRISPNIELGSIWPPELITTFNPISIPLLNTIILLSSGVSVTWSHHEMLNKNFLKSKNSLTLTIFLGIIFTALQGFEYIESPFSISDSAYGTTFFIATGFHGIHVIIGSLFLLISLLRFKNISNPHNHTTAFECAAWYWHFVDVVWLFLYSSIYWWGSFL